MTKASSMLIHHYVTSKVVTQHSSSTPSCFVQLAKKWCHVVTIINVSRFIPPLFCKCFFILFTKLCIVNKTIFFSNLFVIIFKTKFTKSFILKHKGNKMKEKATLSRTLEIIKNAGIQQTNMFAPLRDPNDQVSRVSSSSSSFPSV